VEKISPKMWPMSVISKKQPKVSNHQFGEISPNLVILPAIQQSK
jgi:hypothetical protein